MAKEIQISLIWIKILLLVFPFCSCKNANNSTSTNQLEFIEVYAFPYNMTTTAGIAQEERFHEFKKSLNYFTINGQKITIDVNENLKDLIECDNWGFLNILLTLKFYYNDGTQTELVICQHGGVSINGKMYVDPGNVIDGLIEIIEDESNIKFENVQYVLQKRFYRTSITRYLDYQIKSIGMNERRKKLYDSICNAPIN